MKTDSMDINIFPPSFPRTVRDKLVDKLCIYINLGLMYVLIRKGSINNQLTFIKGMTKRKPIH